MKYLFSILFVLILSGAAFAQSSCPVTLSTNSLSFSYAGNYISGGYAVDVTAASDCTWTATRSDSWIELNGNAGQNTGAATVTRTGSAKFYILYGYNGGDPRQTSITVNNQTIAITQGSGCIYSVQNFEQNFDAAGGSRSYPGYRNGGGPGGCRVTYTTDVDWIHLGATTYTVDANTGAARNGKIAYNYTSNSAPYPLIVYVSQAAGMPAPPANCTYTLTPTAQAFAATGSAGSFEIQTQPGCVWTATNNDAFVTISKASGTGTGTITFDISTNTAPASRSTTVNAQNQIFTITQAGAKSKSRVRFF